MEGARSADNFQGAIKSSPSKIEFVCVLYSSPEFFHQCCLTEETYSHSYSLPFEQYDALVTTWYTKRERWLSSRVRTPWRVCTFLSKIEFTTKSCGTKRRYRVCAHTSLGTGRPPPPTHSRLGALRTLRPCRYLFRHRSRRSRRHTPVART